MKKLKWILLFMVITACNPYPRLQQSIKMKYNINLADHGSILCREYKIKGDTTFVYDAGYYKNKINQHYVNDLIFIGKWNMMIVILKK